MDYPVISVAAFSPPLLPFASSSALLASTHNSKMPQRALARRERKYSEKFTDKNCSFFYKICLQKCCALVQSLFRGEKNETLNSYERERGSSELVELVTSGAEELMRCENKPPPRVCASLLWCSFKHCKWTQCVISHLEKAFT